MKKIIFLLLVFMPYMSVQAQNYDASLIPDSLKENANVVKRFEEIDFEIKSPEKATMHEHHVYTILNEQGIDQAKYESRYDKFTSINYIDGILYDGSGKEIKHVKQKDMIDRSGSGDETLITDERYKTNDFYYENYPFTVDYEEEDDINGLLDIDPWYPIEDFGMSVEYSKYVLTAPKGYVVRYKQFNFPAKPIITETSDKTTYTWEIKNLHALKSENLAPSLREIVPNIIFAPSEFEAQGYSGNMSTWKDYGMFMNQLLKGKDVLQDNIKQQVHALVDNIHDEKKKIEILYDFLQKNTRYISIQLGIGGLQPFDASYVATKKYGDCKALSNYMIALLKEAGIDAKYVEIYGGTPSVPLVADFPSFQGNHVISCVPMQKDTMWLECTSQTESPGFLGDFTGDRKAILIDSDGAHVVSTPHYTANDNLQSRVVSATINENGDLDADVNTKYTGIQEEIPAALMNEASKDERDEYLNNELELPTYQVNKTSYTQQKGTIPVVHEELNVTSPSYAIISGRRLFIAPDLFNKAANKLTQDTTRKYDIVYQYSFKDIDSIHIKIPAGYQPESVPKDISINNEFGIYTISYKIDSSDITCVRMQVRNKSRYPPSEYNKLVDFSNLIYRADRSKIVFVRPDE